MAEVDDIKEIGNKVTKYAEAVTAAQKAAEEITTTQKKLGEQMEEIQSKFKDDGIVNTASEAAAKALEEANQLKAKLESVEKTSEWIQKALARSGTGSGDDPEKKEMEFKAADQTARYLRTGRPMDDEVVERVVKAIYEKSFHGIDESRRENELKTLIAGNDPQGGYFIRPERSATMIKRIFETSPLRNYANIETTGGDTLEFIIDDNEADSGGWVGETQSRGDTDTPDIGKLVIPVHEQFAQPRITQKMIDDAGFDIEGWLSGKVSRKFARVENTAFVVGDGSQKPKGFLSYPAWAVPGTYERKALEQIASGAAADFTADGIKALQNALKEDYQGSAIFATKRANFLNITTLKDNDDQYLLDPRSLKTGDTKVLLGKDVVFMDDIPAVAAAALALAYGDFSVGYTIVDRIGFRVIRDNVTNKPYIKFYTTKRVGGDVTNYEAIKIQHVAVSLP